MNSTRSAPFTEYSDKRGIRFAIATPSGALCLPHEIGDIPWDADIVRKEVPGFDAELAVYNVTGGSVRGCDLRRLSRDDVVAVRAAFKKVLS